MFHQYEEYIYPGGFIEKINEILTGSSEMTVLTNKNAFFINIILIWIQTPLFIILGIHISPIFPIILTTLVFVNGFVHLGVFIKLKKYNPGLIMSIIFNIPMGLYLLFRISNESFANLIELVSGIILGIFLHGLLFIFLRLKKNENFREK